MRKLTIFLLLFATAVSAYAQDLDKLRDRANKFVSLRASGKNKLEMSKYVEAAQREEFIDRDLPTLINAQITGFDFPEDRKVVFVLFSATLMVPQVGQVPAKFRIKWVWDGKDWFIRDDEIQNPFARPAGMAPVADSQAMKIELLSKVLDLGKHVQGESVKESLQFKGDLDRFLTFRHSYVPGLRIEGPYTSGKDTAELIVILDTTMLTEDLKETVELEFFDNAQLKTSASFSLAAQIEPRLKMLQIPETVEPSSAGTVELRLQNVSQTSFRARSIVPTNPAYEVVSYTPLAEVRPGETLQIVLKYRQQEAPTGAGLNLQFTPAVLAVPSFSLPLKVRLPEAQSAPEFSREQLDEIIKRVPKQ